MTLAQLKALIRTQTLVETDDVSDAELLTFLNNGINELTVRFRWPFLEKSSTISAANGTQAYSLPADYSRLVAVVDNDNTTRLTRITPELAFEQWGGDPPTGTDATWFFIWGEKLNLIPVPTAADTDRYTLYYLKTPTLLAADGDSPEFASQFHHILALYAAARVWESEEDLAKMARLDEAFGQQIEVMARYYLKRDEDFPIVWGDGMRPPASSRVIYDVRFNMPFLDG